MSLASDTATRASNMNLALTLNWFVHELELSQRAGRAGISITTALDMINEHLADLERQRVQLVNSVRAHGELTKGIAEVLS